MRSMSHRSAQLRGAVAARDAALGRVRRTTTFVAAGCVALAAAFAALAAGSTHARRTAAPVRAAPGRKATRSPVAAPAPPLVAVAQAADQAPQPAPAPAAAPPTTPPVAVSGGS